MRTTIRLNDELLGRVKRKAAREGRTFTSLVEEGLLTLLSKPSSPERKRVQLPISKAGGGVVPGVDINSNAALADLMDSE